MLPRSSFKKSTTSLVNNINEERKFESLQRFRKPSLQNHDLYTVHRHNIGDVVTDQITGVTPEVINDDFKCCGIGRTKGRGLLVKDLVKRGTMFSWTEKPFYWSADYESYFFSFTVLMFTYYDIRRTFRVLLFEKKTS